LTLPPLPSPMTLERTPLIHASRNKRLRVVRALTTRRGRRRLERFLLEGPKVLAEILARRPERLELILVREGSENAKRVEPVLAEAVLRGVPWFPVQGQLYDELTDTDTPQPVLGVGLQAWADLTALLAGPDPTARHGVVALAGVQDPGNVGTILRSARFFGLAGAVFLPGSQDPWAPKVVRASAGTLLEHPVAKAEDLAQLLSDAAAAGLTPVTLDAHGGRPPSPDSFPPRALLVLGSEGQGLPPEAAPPELRAAVVSLTIPAGDPRAESLNVGVAFGVAAAAWAQAPR
jgi:RNA methyltransferase, TrmH family